jgi:mono/diheme cytochrome c family protein
MRKTQLKRVTAGVVGFTVAIAVLMAVFRAFTSGAGASTEVEQGAVLFAENGCGQCHYTDRTETKVGPGLKGLFNREELPASGRPVSEETVRRQLKTPFKNMPSFEDRLTEAQSGDLIAYLKTL